MDVALFGPGRFPSDGPMMHRQQDECRTRRSAQDRQMSPMHYRLSRTSLKHEGSSRVFPAVPVVSTLHAKLTGNNLLINDST